MPPEVEIPAAATVVNPHKSERCKKMGKAIRASVLVLLLACSAQAGWIQNPAPAPPPPSLQTTAAQEPAYADQELTTGGEMPDDVADGLAGIALDLLAVLPSLL